MPTNFGLLLNQIGGMVGDPRRVKIERGTIMPTHTFQPIMQNDPPTMGKYNYEKRETQKLFFKNLKI